MFQRRKTPPPYRRIKPRSAASKNAGHAATVRNESPSSTSASTSTRTSTSRPKVHMPKKLSDHNQEDIIIRSANRFAPYSLCVDTLLRSLRTIRSDPNNRKYQSIDTTGAAFRRSLTAPGVIDFLKAVNFHSSPNSNRVLTLSHYDPAAFYLAISALERIQNTSPEYSKNKALRTFQKEIDNCLVTSSNDDTETLAREKYLSKLPREPTNGGSPITVEFGLAVRNTANNNGNDIGTTNVVDTDYKEQTTTKKISRGFDHDDTLGDVVNWLGGQASAIPNKLRTGEWTIIDRNRIGSEEDYNYHRLDVSELSDKTLHYIGCWPSGRIAIVPRLTTTMTTTTVLAN